MQCINLLEQLREAALAAQLQEALQSMPLQTPEDHKGSAETDMFCLNLGLDERRKIHTALTRAVSQNLSTPATRSRGLAGFLAAWREYLDYEEAPCGKS